MAYLPPINGGRINANITGNTAAVGTVISSGTMVLSGGNNVTLSQNGSSINIAGQSQSVQTQNLHNVTLSGNTAGAMAHISSGTLTLAGGNNITLSQNGNAVTISAGAQIGRFEHPMAGFASLNAVGQGSLSIQHIYVPFNVTGTAMKIGGSLNIQTSTNGSSRSASMSLWMGVYTLNGSTLSLASSGSANNSFVYSAGTSHSSGNTSVTGMRQLTVPVNVNMAPGEYWVGAVVSSATGPTQSAGFTVYGNDQIVGGASNAVLMPFGSGTAQARDVMLFQGIYTSNTVAGPSSIGGASIQNLPANAVMAANFYHAIYSATY